MFCKKELSIFTILSKRLRMQILLNMQSGSEMESMMHRLHMRQTCHLSILKRRESVVLVKAIVSNR